MDPRLQGYYERELEYLQQMGAEFAAEYPKIARRLALTGQEVADPYVERLLEGVAFLAARVQLKMDAEFPRFTQALLEVVHPHFLAPTPSMLVARFEPDMDDKNLEGGVQIARGSGLQAAPAPGEVTGCEFRTGHDVTLWPVTMASAAYFTFAPDLPLASSPMRDRMRAGVRFKLKTARGIPFSRLGLDRLPIYVAGQSAANAIHASIAGGALGVGLVPPTSAGPPIWLSAPAVRPVGYRDAEALLPVTRRGFQGYRLLQEYFSFPQRFRFFEIVGLARALSTIEADEVEVVLPLASGDGNLEGSVDASTFVLFATPAINLFEKRADRINLSDGLHEYHVVPDRTRPLDFEVYAVEAVKGFGTGHDGDQTFLPFYAADGVQQRGRGSAFFTVRREPHRPSSAQQRKRPRSSYVGGEVFLSLVDQHQAPFHEDLRQLSVQTWCTNRDLALFMPSGGVTDLTLEASAPVRAIRVVAGPSRPCAPLADDRAGTTIAAGGSACWRALSHLSLTYLSLMDTTPDQGPVALRELLSLYVAGDDAAGRRQVDGIQSASAVPVVRRLPGPGPIAFGRGLEVTIDVDEHAFEGSSLFLLGSVLDRYFARHVSLNSFIETVCRSTTRGELYRWPRQWGAKPTF